MAILTRTDFTGLANGAAWPAPWSFRYGNNANAKAYVQDGAGRIHIQGGGQWIDKAIVTHTGAPGNFELTLKLKSTADSFPKIEWRAAGTEVHTCYNLSFDWDGSIRMHRMVNWTEVELKNVGGKFSYNVWHRVRLRVEGANFKARVWKDGATEPAAWDIEITDTTLTSGDLALYFGGGKVTTGFDGDFDDIIVSDFAAASIPVTVPAASEPVAIDLDGTANDRLQLTAVPGVIFTVLGRDYTTTTSIPMTPSADVTVTARAATGYVLSGTTSWTFGFTNYVPLTPATVPPSSVPTATDRDGVTGDTVNVTAVPGVIWTVDGRDYTTTASIPYTKGVPVTVTARAATGYFLSGTTSWSLTFTNYVPPPIVEPPPPPPYSSGAFFYDQTVMNDIADEDMELPDSVGQEIWRNYVNDLGPSAEVTLQLPEIEDFDLDEQAADMFIEDESDPVLDELLDEEFRTVEESVPYEWRYWEHAPDEFPLPDESKAPPMPSGWVNPDTDELVP